MTPDELMAKLAEMLSSSGNTNTKPKSNNPAKYPRSVKLAREFARTPEQKDRVDSMIMMITEIEMRRKEIEDLGEQANIKMHEMALTRAKFFRMAAETFPEVATKKRTEDGAGWREWKGDYYLVAWDTEEAGEEQSGTSKDESFGNYI